MKVYFYLIIVMTFFAGCSTSEDPQQIQEAIPSLSSAADLRATVNSEKFQEFIRSKALFLNKAQDSNYGNGIIFMEDGALFGFFTGTGVLFFAPSETNTLKIFPNGTGSINLNSKDFFVAWFSFVGDPNFSNFCYDKSWGHLSVNFRGKLEVDESEFGTFYNVIDPFSSAYHFKASNVRLSDETTIFDEETQTETCNGDATEEKIINFRRVIANQEFVLDIIDVK